MRLVVPFVFAAIFGGISSANADILIDQNAALVGNVTPGDDPGFPITINRPGTYRLSSDLTVPDYLPGGIEIASDNVVIDLAGYTIQPASGDSISAGIFDKGVARSDGLIAYRNNIIVRNGTITAMDVGIHLLGRLITVSRMN